MKSEIEKSFHGFGGPYLQKAEAMRSLCYAFLYEEIRNGEESDNDEQLGEAYYLLYVLSGRRNNAAGQKAVDCKNRKMLFLAMEAAINNWTDSSFGYSRYNAAKYIEELEKVGDPDGARLRTKLNDRLAWEKEQERFDNAIEAKEREQAEREAIYKRWQAESKADAIERETNMYFHGDYSTDFERTITGKMSQRDYTINEIWREKFLEHQE